MKLAYKNSIIPFLEFKLKSDLSPKKLEEYIEKIMFYLFFGCVARRNMRVAYNLEFILGYFCIVEGIYLAKKSKRRFEEFPLFQSALGSLELELIASRCHMCN